ncbi:hypothetical protein ASG96_09330 [Terrabacter sp. Soil810]|nr:hypothetical protein ASD90_15360 [Terrabacter sp. Root181]KRF40986.1 hypothetical protein ASG96_09330 [Terrabacter sp. Soil810]
MWVSPPGAARSAAEGRQAEWLQLEQVQSPQAHVSQVQPSGQFSQSHGLCGSVSMGTAGIWPLMAVSFGDVVIVSWTAPVRR